MIIFTNSGDSYLINSAGNYDLAMLGGNDTLTVQGGNTIYAFMGEGDDLVTIKAGAGSVDVYGESGKDRFDIWTGASANGGGDNDLFNIRGGGGHSLTGGLGDDRFNYYADVTNTFADGGDGNDDFFGYHHVIGGNISGWNGNDYFVGFANLNGQTVNLIGGAGNDIYRADPTAPATIIEYADEGTDSVQVARGAYYELSANVENITVSGFAGSTSAQGTLIGNTLNNTIVAHNNVDMISGMEGNDRLFGKGGDDTIYGGDGNDYVDGGSGNDVLYGHSGNDTLQGRTGDDWMLGGDGDDTYYVDSASDQVVEGAGEGTDTVRTSVNHTMYGNVENGIMIGTGDLQMVGNDLDNRMTGNSGNNLLDGWNGNDTLNGGAGHDQLFGYLGNDTLLGGEGDDLLFGETDNDTLNGGAGNDSLVGSAGVDVLTGGDGQDMFVYHFVSDSAPGASDLITDFSSVSGVDKLDLSAIDADTTVDGDQAFVINTTQAPAGVAGDLWYTFDTEAGHLVWHGDVNGDSVADFELRVVNTPDLYSMWFSDIII